MGLHIKLHYQIISIIDDIKKMTMGHGRNVLPRDLPTHFLKKIAPSRNLLFCNYCHSKAQFA